MRCHVVGGATRWRLSPPADVRSTHPWDEVGDVMTVRRGLSFGLATLLSACSSGANSPASTPGMSTVTLADLHASTTSISPTTTALGALEALPLGAPGCDPPSPFVVTEIRETAGSGQLYGLVMAQWPITVGKPVKIVWRMTGTGDLAASATSPTGRDLPLTFGPEMHPGSTYDRPGDEWGTGYTFTEPGCWALHLQRDDTQGDVWVVVDP